MFPKISEKEDIGPQRSKVKSSSIQFNKYVLGSQHSFNYSFNYFPGTIEGPRDTAVNKTKSSLVVGVGDGEQINKKNYSISDGDKSYRENT